MSHEMILTEQRGRVAIVTMNRPETLNAMHPVMLSELYRQVQAWSTDPSVGAIVVGHVAAVVLAHRQALRDSATRPVLAGLPLVLLMIGYTVLSLWIIAQPITLEPRTTPTALVLR